MSSIRPLATITLLALIGVFLYMKINETEPPLPTEIADWTMSADLDITEQPDIPSFGQPSNPVFAAPDAAPAFAASPASTAPAAPTFVAQEAPPANTLAPASAAPPIDMPELPPMPTIPPSDQVALEATEPPVPTQQLPESQASPNQVPAQPSASLFSTTRVSVQAALDRGQLSQALLMLSDWYGDPSLSSTETQEVNQLLGQLAGSVIYSTEPRLEPLHMVQAGEKLQYIAQKYNVPWQLLAKINSIADPDQIQPGQKLKVVQGPFSALIDLSERRLTLKLDRRYAGQFSIEVDPTTSIEEGLWTINQKLLTPSIARPAMNSPVTGNEERTILLTNSSGGSNQIAILRGANTSAPGDPMGRVIRLQPSEVEDVFDILSLGSQVVIRR